MNIHNVRQINRDPTNQRESWIFDYRGQQYIYATQEQTTTTSGAHQTAHTTVYRCSQAEGRGKGYAIRIDRNPIRFDRYLPLDPLDPIQGICQLFKLHMLQ